MLLKLQNQKKLDQIPLSIDIHFDFYTHFLYFYIDFEASKINILY